MDGFPEPAYRPTGVRGILVVTNDGLTSAGGADPANDRIIVDLDPQRGPSAIRLELGFATAAAPVRTVERLAHRRDPAPRRPAH